MISKRKQSIRGKNVKGKFTGSGLVGDHPLYGHCFKGKKDHGGQPGLILIIKMVKYDFLQCEQGRQGRLFCGVRIFAVSSVLVFGATQIFLAKKSFHFSRNFQILQKVVSFLP